MYLINPQSEFRIPQSPDVALHVRPGYALQAAKALPTDGLAETDNPTEAPRES